MLKQRSGCAMVSKRPGNDVGLMEKGKEDETYAARQPMS